MSAIEVSTRTEILHDQVLVLGADHLFVGDDGVGFHVVRELRRGDWPDHVTFADGGSGGCQLLEALQSAPRVILIDAICDGLWPGSVTHYRAVEPGDFPPALGAQDAGLKALLTAAALLGDLPDVEVITISVDELRPAHGGLSADVAAALPEVERIVRRLVN